MLAFYRSALTVATAAVTMGCGMEYVPSAQQLRDPKNPSAAFLHRPTSVRGIYGNLDVDSAIFEYHTSVEQESDFWTAIETASDEQGWTKIEDADSTTSVRRFLRITPRTGQRVTHGVEETRLSFHPDTQLVIVAWVQSDQGALPTSFPTDGAEGSFAERVVWPRFASETNR